ncbi:hypothetical protein D3C80_1353110 [compost metagenome]
MLVAAGQAQLPLTTTTGRRPGPWCLQQGFARRCRGIDHLGLATGQRAQGIVGECASPRRRPGHHSLELADLVQGLLDLGQQLLVGEGLADEVGNAGLDSLDHVLLVATAGDHDEGHRLEAVLLSAPGEQLQARHLRHFPVAQDQVERLAREHGLRLAAIDRVFDSHSRKGITQAFLHQVTNERRIIHNQHTDLTH